MRRLLTALAFLTGCAFAQQLKPIQSIDPQYSDEARLAGLEGRVLVTGKIAGNGSMQDPRVIQPLGLGLDEQALAMASQLRFIPDADPAQSEPIIYPIAFTLPAKQSHWHLTGVQFKTPAGVSRPTFAKADYPLGSGISLAAYEEARLLVAIGRGASATVSFDIDERGDPQNFQVVSATADVWGPEAVLALQGWQFHPAMKAGSPVSTSCTLTLVWGPVDFTSHEIRNQLGQLYPPPPSPINSFPAVVFKIEPEYTEAASRAGIEGTVQITMNVDEQGAPTDLRTVGSLGLGLEESARDAVSRWRFNPALVNGQPAKVPMTVRVHFSLAGTESSVFAPPATKPAASNLKQ